MTLRTLRYWIFYPLSYVGWVLFALACIGGHGWPMYERFAQHVKKYPGWRE